MNVLDHHTQPRTLAAAHESHPAITVQGLHMSYGDVEAVRGLDLEVAHGEIFAFLGPNGAGKTTTVEILEGFRARSAGSVQVLGEDPQTATTAWRDRIGIVLQDSQPDPGLSVREALELYAGYYSRPRSIDETLELIGLAASADAIATALRRAAAPARLRSRARRRSRPDLPGRAHDRLRPLRAARGLGCHRRPARARQDHLPHDPLHGRGGAAGRPHRGHRSRAHRRAGHARDARRARSRRRDDHLRTARGGRVRPSARAVRRNRERRPREPADHTPLHDLGLLAAWASRHAAELPDLAVARPSLEDIYLELTATGRTNPR